MSWSKPTLNFTLKTYFLSEFHKKIDAFDEAKVGTVYCLERYRGQWSNVGTHMRRIIKQAGLELWPKLFQNCRSTRETELFKATGGNVKAVCEWIGNSPQVALKHYAQVTDADLKAAAKMTVLNDAEKTVQEGVHNRVHPKPETSGNVEQENQENENDNSNNPCNCHNLPNTSEPCFIQDNSCPVGVTGLEPEIVTNESQGTYEKGENQGVHNRVQNPYFLTDLATKWDLLTDAEKQIIMKLLK